MSNFRNNHPGIFKALCLLPLICALAYGIFYYLAETARRQAGEIFAREMLRQQMLHGSVTAQQIDADIAGNVYLQNLSWLDAQGQPVLFIPQARLKVKVLDVVLGHFSKDTVQEIELTEPHFSVSFNENMQPEILRAQDIIDKDKMQEQSPPAAGSGKNLDLQGKELPQAKLIIKNGELAAFYKERRFALHEVNASLQAHGSRELELHFACGAFGGVMQGESMNLDGIVNLDGSRESSLNLGLYKLVPKSLGLGDIEDEVTVAGQVMGTPQRPVINGAVMLEELNLPALHFTKVAGNFHYEDALVKLTDVTASLYGGAVTAEGEYDFDSRDYRIDAEGQRLIAALAARDSRINCKADLWLHMRGYGSSGDVLTYGRFTSDGGSIYLVPFSELSGNFSNRQKNLQFRDVKVRTNFGTFTTDAFSIVNGKVHVGKVFVEEEGGLRRVH